MSKLYYIKVEDYELDNIEMLVRKKMVEMMTREIIDHSRSIAKSILQNKPITKKKWYEVEERL